MATTTQDQNRAKFLELRAQGMSVADARDKSYWPTPTAPVAPTPAVTPPVAPAAPLVPTPTVTPITNQEVQQGVNAVWWTAEQRRQTRTGITEWQTITPTPFAPVAPAPVTESPAPVTEKTGITQDAFQQAKLESEKIKAQNDAVMAQNKQKSDLAREDAALAAQAAIPTDKKGIVNALVTGATIPVQKTEAYNKAVVTSDLFKKFSWMTSEQLFQNLQQGQIGTELSGLLAQNPNFAIAKQKYEQVQKTNAINSLTQATYNAANGKTTPVVDELAKIESKYSAPPGTNAQAYEQFVTQDPDVVKSWLELKNLATQINTVTKTYNDALKSLKEQYPDMPASALITLMGTRTKDTKELLDSYISAKELAKGDFDLAMKMADGHYNAVSKDIAVQQQEAQQIAQEKRQMQNTLALWQAQFDQKIAQQAQAMNDPTMAISTMIEEYKKLGVPFTRSTQQVISDFQSSGQDLPTYLSGLQKLIQSKPEYQRVQALQQGQLSDREKFAMQTAVENQRDIRNFAQQKELAYLNKDLSRQQFLFELENDPEKKAKALELEQKLNSNKSLFDVLGKNVGTYEGNRGYDLAGAIGDPLPAGGNWTVKSIDTAGEQVWSIFIGGKGKKPYGNTVVMQDENGNEIRYSHLQNIGVKPGDVLWFGDIVGTRGNTGNVMGANGEKLTAEQLKAGRWAHLDVEIKSNWKLLSNEDQVKFLKGLKAGGTQPLADQKFTQFNQTTSKFYSNPQVKSFEDALNAGWDMIASLKSANWPGDVGAVFSFMKALDPASVVKEGEFKLARESGGLDAKFDNIYWKIINGEQLTEEQRKAFGKISFEYIKSKWRMYDAKYNDMIKVLKNQQIPESYYPTRMTDYIKQYENGWNTNIQQTSTSWLTGDALYSEWYNFNK